VWTSLENAAIGPVVAAVSFVCSVGNVPLAAALWRAGISFGGVVSFLFGDLITIPLLLIYRKQYGGRTALRMLGVFWLVMSAAGLATQYLFDGAGWIPTVRPRPIIGAPVGWGWITYLDLVAVGLLAVVYGVHRAARRAGDRTGVAIDPVCGMQVDTAHAPATVIEAGRTSYFCSERCRDRHLANAVSSAASGPAPTDRRHDPEVWFPGDHARHLP
jgi:YHS domain-containing protein